MRNRKDIDKKKKKKEKAKKKKKKIVRDQFKTERQKERKRR